MIRTLVLALVLWGFNLVSGSEESRCYSQAICTNGISEESQPTFMQVHPPPECYSFKADQTSDVLDKVFDNTIKQFRRDLKSAMDKLCPSCEVDGANNEDIDITKQKKCYVPAICNNNDEALVTWMQIHPYPSCQESEADEALRQRTSELFNQSRNEAIKDLRNVFDRCGIGKSTERKKVFDELKREEYEPSREIPKSDLIGCYAPATCQYEDRVGSTWQKISSADGCNRAILYNEQPENVLDSALQNAIRELKDILMTEQKCSPGATSGVVALTTAASTTKASKTGALTTASSAAAGSIAAASTTVASATTASTTAAQTTGTSKTMGLTATASTTTTSTTAAQTTGTSKTMGLTATASTNTTSTTAAQTTGTSKTMASTATASTKLASTTTDSTTMDSTTAPSTTITSAAEGSTTAASTAMTSANAISRTAASTPVVLTTATSTDVTSTTMVSTAAASTTVISTAIDPKTAASTTMTSTAEGSATAASTSEALATAAFTNEETTMSTTEYSEIAVSTMAPCLNYSSNSSCNMTYGGKCFRFLLSDYHVVNFTNAEDMCNKIGFQLGNITDDCLFKAVKSYMESNKDFLRRSFTLWTGMSATSKNIVEPSWLCGSGVKFYEGLQYYFWLYKRRYFVCLYTAESDVPLEGAFCQNI